MAARLNPHHSDMVRSKIQASQLINRLSAHVLGEIELSSSQVQAAKILLDKVVSNAPQQTEISGPDGGPLQVDKVERVIVRGNAAD